ncbi:MAG: hypothetical protein ACOYMA_16395 [Bacteroidia bacterium]
MKKLLLLACGLIIASTSNFLFAQKADVIMADLDYNETQINDTLIIKLSGSDKILLIGGDLKDMHKYKQVDSIKTLFVNDISAAQNNNTLTTDATKVYYFITSNGKRRLKAENVDLSENAVDINYELKRLQLDLPKYEYHIFDLKYEFQIQIYLADPKQLKTVLENINIYEAITYTNNTAKKDFKRTYKIELNTENGYKLGNKTQGRMDALMINGKIGIGILGNTIAPIAGIEMMLELSNKYSIGKYKIGLMGQTFPLVNMVAGEINSVSWVKSYDLKLMVNMNDNDRNNPNYLGFQFGIMKNLESEAYNNAFKIGVIQRTKYLNYSIDHIIIGDKKDALGLTVYFPF